MAPPRALPLMLAGAPLAAGAPPRQPRGSYLRVPEVPRPPTFALAELLARLEHSQLDGDGDGGCSEGEFVAAVESEARRAAGEAWSAVDANSDGQLDLDELAEAVQPLGRGDGFSAPQPLWTFLWLLARRFQGSDLERSARVGVGAMGQEVAALLREVPFLDERRALFDAAAGPGVGDDGGAFGAAEWSAWRRRYSGRDKRRRRRRKPPR
ncbi:unnamed protein product [Prorocentrum cordatum]|uniref:EF-hand domain-containing protein n=1 Tax=Prorocentrum cordatum TaxID=2364126 RepID=A0ABN9WZM6_9DINO|nr:unnamed protein product [Polarella glacialis]